MDDRSWLFPRGADRQRMLEMDRALRPVRQRAFAVLTVALLACGPWLGWWTTLPLVLAALIFRRGRADGAEGGAARVRDLRRLGGVGAHHRDQRRAHGGAPRGDARPGSRCRS